MGGLLDQVGSVVGDVLNSVPVRLLVVGSVAYVTVVWLAAAHWVYRDMRRRRPDPVSPYLAATAIVLASPVLLPIAALTYFILRPRETLAEARERELTERLEVIGAEMDLACPGCRRRVEDDWLLCPACRTRLASRCRSCGRTMGLDWETCGFCGSDFGRPVVPHRLPAAVRGSLPAQGGAAAVGGEGQARRYERPARRSTQPSADRSTEPRREVLEPGV